MPQGWRFYRAVVGKVIGWSMAELMAMPWDEFLLEAIEARRLQD